MRRIAGHLGTFVLVLAAAGAMLACGASQDVATGPDKSWNERTTSDGGAVADSSRSGGWGYSDAGSSYDSSNRPPQSPGDFASGPRETGAAHDAGAPPAWGSNIGTGGAQDIGQFRKILESGGIPKPETLDANGFFNEHHTTLPPPKCGQLFCLHGMLARNRSYVNGKVFTVLQLGLNSAKDISKLPRLPLNLVVVIDVSGSMSGDKIEYVKKGLKLLVDELQPNDLLGVVVYSGSASVKRSPTVVKDKTGLKTLIDGLQASGGTNFYAGLEAGFKQVQLNASDEYQNRVILLSDGMPTAGNTSESAIIAMSNRYVKTGVGLTTIGVGLQFNVRLMRTLAEAGSGNYYFLDNNEAIREVFKEEMAYFVVPIAFDVALTVKTGPAFRVKEIFGTNLWTGTSYGGEIRIPSVFLTGRTSHKDPPASGGRGRRGGGSAIMIHLEEPATGLPLGQTHPVSELELSFRPAGKQNRVWQKVRVTYTPESQHLSSGFYSHREVEKNYTMLNIFIGLRDASRAAVEGRDMDLALKLLLDLDARVSALNTLIQDEDIKADLKLIRKFRDNLKAKGAKAPPVKP